MDVAHAHFLCFHNSVGHSWTRLRVRLYSGSVQDGAHTGKGREAMFAPQHCNLTVAKHSRFIVERLTLHVEADLLTRNEFAHFSAASQHICV